MKLQPITTRQFIGGTVLVTLAFALLVLTQGNLPVLFSLPLVAATFLIMPPDVRKQPATRSQWLVVLGTWLVTAAFIWWAVTHHTPESDAWCRSLNHSFSRPIVAAPLWLGFLFPLYRRWRLKPPLRDESTHEHD